jgi:hypothetical protein
MLELSNERGCARTARSGGGVYLAEEHTRSVRRRLHPRHLGYDSTQCATRHNETRVHGRNGE